MDTNDIIKKFMKITRTIVPVSIGAFCIERFVDEATGINKFVVVYDCGKGRRANTSSSLRNIIDLELGTLGKSVDFLFLSHFDNDHINGLSYLIATGLVNRTDTTVFLPLIPTPFVYLYEYINNLQFLITVEKLQRLGIKVVFVRPDEHLDDKVASQVVNDNHEPEYARGYEIIDSYSTLHPFSQGRIFWKYIPFYLQDNQIYNEFLEHISNFNPYGITEDDFPNFLDWPDDMKEWLKNRYVSFRYSKGQHVPSVSPINMNAMLLISDKTDNAHMQGIRLKEVHLHDKSVAWPNLNQCSALYTSDVGLNNPYYFDRVKSAIANCIDGQRVGLFQIPHHASVHCYNQDTFSKMPFEMAFCNCKQYSTNPAYCDKYEADAKTLNVPYAIVDEYPAHRLEMDIWVR